MQGMHLVRGREQSDTDSKNNVEFAGIGLGNVSEARGLCAAQLSLG